MSASFFVALLLAFLPLYASGAPVPFQPQTGYITVDKTNNGNMFYWFFEAIAGNSSAPVILWLQGGPGCSGAMGLFNENGPYQVTDDLQLQMNPHTWNEHYHMLYLDSPVGTGFSYVNNAGLATNEDDVVTDLYNALTTFFGELYPQFAKNALYIFGESYAGKYIPSLADYISNQAIAAGKDTVQINLKGVGIGDGWVDPVPQTLGIYSSFCYDTGLIDDIQRANIEVMEREVVAAVDQGRWADATNLWNNITLQIMEGAGMVNPSDIRKYGFASFAPFDVTTKFVTQPSVMAKLRVAPEANFTMINGTVAQALFEDNMKTVVPSVISILGAGLPVLIFNGNFDFTVPIIGTEAWLDQMQWQGSSGWRAATRSVWTHSSQTAGYMKQYANLMFVTVVQAGHMAAMDQPARVKDMVTRFIEGKPFH